MDNGSDRPRLVVREEGERLRDRFAMAVLPAVFSQLHTRNDSKSLAKAAYMIADAMMKERDNG